MSKRSHPLNPWVRNSRLADLLVFLTRHRIPIVSRGVMILPNASRYAIEPKPAYR